MANMPPIVAAETFLVPAELASLPSGWNVTSDETRRSADPAGALLALDRALAVLPNLREPAEEELPTDLIAYFDFTAGWLAEAMPTLSSVSVETIEKLLATQQTSASTSTALAEYWPRYITAGIARSSLAAAMSQLASADAVARFLAIVGRELPLQSVYWASTLPLQRPKSTGR